MLEFKDKNEYSRYVEELREAIKNNSWKEYMDNNEYMDIYHLTGREWLMQYLIF